MYTSFRQEIPPVNELATGGSVIGATSIGAIITNIGLPSVPVAEFVASVVSGVSPLVVSFTNLSMHATSYRWYFTNGVTVDSYDANPTVMLFPGTYDVRLEADGPGGTDSIVKSAYITVSAPPPGVGKSRHAFLEAMKGFGDLELGSSYAGLKKILTIQKKSLTVRKTK